MISYTFDNDFKPRRRRNIMNDTNAFTCFFQYLTLFKELGQKQTLQQSRGRKINAMDAYFYQMVERVLREELAVTFGESQQEAGRRLLEVLR